ncbi:MAG: hypothetical protein WC662_02750 [Candidatus Paceibacterota bacterium]|jgi:hypothetical protein
MQEQFKTNAEDLNKRTEEANAKLMAGGPGALEGHLELKEIEKDLESSDIRFQAELENIDRNFEEIKNNINPEDWERCQSAKEELLNSLDDCFKENIKDSKEGRIKGLKLNINTIDEEFIEKQTEQIEELEKLNEDDLDIKNIDVRFLHELNDNDYISIVYYIPTGKHVFKGHFQMFLWPYPNNHGGEVINKFRDAIKPVRRDYFVTDFLRKISETGKVVKYSELREVISDDVDSYIKKSLIEKIKENK